MKLDLDSSKMAKGIRDGILAGGDFRVGGTRRIVVPAELAYGKTGFPDSGENAGKLIPPGATLYVEIRLRSIALSKGLGFGLNLV